MLKEEELNSIKSMGALCELYFEYNEELGIFQGITINGVELDYKDFGTKEDIDEENAEEYCCGDMQFIPHKIIYNETLKKYNITLEEARKIQEKLGCLSFGRCGWCS